MKKKSSIKVIALVLVLSVPFFGQAPSTQAAATAKQVKLVRGKWYKSSSAYMDYYLKFTKKYCLWYKNGRIKYKDKIVSVKKSNGKYIYKMRQKDGTKFCYIGTANNNKITDLDFFGGWKESSGGYSGSSSMHREKPW